MSTQQVSDSFALADQALEDGLPDEAAEALGQARAAFAGVDEDQRPALVERGRQLAERLAALQQHQVQLLDGDPGVSSPPPDEEDLGAWQVPAPGPRQVGIPDPPAPEQLLGQMGLREFRPGQREAVEAALAGRDSLVVMPTGGGKSLCYQLPAIASERLTVVVSPLIALIADQHARLQQAGQASVMLASTQSEEDNRAALAAVRGGQARIVFCAPERLASAGLRGALQQRDIALFVVDEAHCVSEWGHDFRPDYLRLAPVIHALGRPPVMACTATATPQVAAEIAERLELRDPLLVRRGFDRPNLSFDVVSLDGEGAVARKRGLLLAGLEQDGMRPAIVYCGTRKDTDAVAELLTGQGITAGAYHAGLEHQQRKQVQQRFMAGELEVVVATNAFGMGVDKANIRSVWHWALPTSVEAYYQEAGRAGRDGQPGRAILLASRYDLGRLVQFIKNDQLEWNDVRRVVERLRARAKDGVLLLDAREGDDQQRVALGVAERAGAVSLRPARAGQLELRFAGSMDRNQVSELCRQATGRRWEAYAALKAFASSKACRRRQLLDHFGDDEPLAPQGRCCDVCAPIDWIDLASVAPVSASGSRSTRRGAPAPQADSPPVDEGALGELKRWRLERADGKPAYTVATNAALEEILRQKPQDADGLLQVRGVGPAFVSKHGAELLALLRQLG